MWHRNAASIQTCSCGNRLSSIALRTINSNLFYNHSNETIRLRLMRTMSTTELTAVSCTTFFHHCKHTFSTQNSSSLQHWIDENWFRVDCDVSVSVCWWVCARATYGARAPYGGIVRRWLIRMENTEQLSQYCCRCHCRCENFSIEFIYLSSFCRCCYLWFVWRIFHSLLFTHQCWLWHFGFYFSLPW